MKAEKTKYSKAAIIITEEELKRLDAIAAQVDQARYYVVNAHGDLTVNCENIDELLRFLKTSASPVKQMIVNTNPVNNRSLSLLASIGRNSVLPIYYQVKGSETEVPYITSVLDEWISDIKPWYSWITRTDVVMVLMAVIVGIDFPIVALAFIAYAQVHPGEIFTLTLGANTATYFFAGGIPVVAIALLGVALNRVKSRIFPKSVLAIGEGLRRHKRVVFFRRAIGVGLAVLSTISLAIISNLLTPK
jgi:hypothetical protein